MSTTEGKLNASFEGEPAQENFTADGVRYLGSVVDTDSYLEGADGANRSIGFYLPDANIASGTYDLEPDGDISAYYAVKGSLTWVTLRGSIDIKSDLSKETMTIQFKFSAKEGGSGVRVIEVRGQGDFKGRIPWTTATRSSLKNRLRAKT